MDFPHRQTSAFDLLAIPHAEIAREMVCDLPIDRWTTTLRKLPADLAWRFRLWPNNADPERVLLHLVAPTWLVRSRLLDDPTITVCTQQQHGLWVPVGWTSPTEPLISPGRWIISLPKRTLELLAKDFAEPRAEYTLATTACESSITHDDRRWPIGLKLLPSHDSEPARFWVLRDDALGQLSLYCRTANELLLQQYQVAVAQADGTPVVLLRATHSKLPPPVFIGVARAFRPWLRMANVFLPVRQRVSPIVRRDALREWFDANSRRLYWFDPLEGGAFRLESVTEEAFRPLVEMVDYARNLPKVNPHTPWKQAHPWDFEPYTIAQETSVAPKVTPAPVTQEAGPNLVQRAFGWLKSIKRRPPVTVPTLSTETPATEDTRSAPSQADRLHLARPDTNSHAIERCQELERLLLHKPPADKETLAVRWSELAAAYDAIGNDADAATCWLNAIWLENKHFPLWSWGWLRSEAKSSRHDMATLDPAPWLHAPATPTTMRTLAAWIVWGAHQPTVPPFLLHHAAAIHAKLDADEGWLPIRAAWLARLSLAKVGGNADVLGLARTRDRIMQRLYQTGLSIELDAPSFFRFAGDGLRERFHEARKWLTDKHDLIQQWLGQLGSSNRFAHTATTPTTLHSYGLEANIPHTQAYANYIFAWGLLRFSQLVAAEALRKQAMDTLSDDPAHAVLREAFEYRMSQVREGKPSRGPLPTGLLSRIQSLDATTRYVVDKLREHSRILEPSGIIDTYRLAGFGHRSDVVALLHNAPIEILNRELQSAFKATTGHAIARLPALMTSALERAIDLSEENRDTLGTLMPQAMRLAEQTPRVYTRLLEKGLHAAIAWDRADWATDFAARVLQWADGRAGWDVAEGLTNQAVRCLQRFGMKKEADRLLLQISNAILQGQSYAKLRTQRPNDWPTALRVLLNVAGGWYFAGRDEQAHMILDEARKDLFAEQYTPTDRTLLAFSYTNALAHAPVRIALGRLEEMFQRLRGIHTTGTTNRCYSLKPLLLIETAVRVVVSDDFTMGPEVRSWLDADEFAVRRRIHDDLKARLREQGLA